MTADNPGNVPVTAGDALKWGRAVFEAAGSNPAMALLDAEVLLAHVLDKDRVYLLAHPEARLKPAEAEKFRELVGERQKGVPIAYITGEKEFMSLSFSVNTTVLIPRPETEVMVEKALSFLEPMASPLVAETCTGSGCIAVSLAKYNPRCLVRAVDISGEALEVALGNAEKHGVDDRVGFFRGNLFEPLLNLEGDAGRGGRGSYDLALANPPYIEDANYLKLDTGVHCEPSLALLGGFDGLRFYPELLDQAFLLLKPGGLLLLEIGAGQGSPARELAVAHGGFREVAVIADYAGRDRILHAVKNGVQEI